MRAILLLVAVASVSAATAAESQVQAPRPQGAALSVWSRGEWREWWRADAAPRRWSAPDPIVADAMEWRPAAPGVEWGRLRISGSGEAWRLAVIAVRIDPALNDLRLDVIRRRDGRTAPWSVSRASREAVAAFNAGHFSTVAPWGWVVMDGREILPPGQGPLSSAVIADSSGRVAIVVADSIDRYRRRPGIAYAIQSYPTVLYDDGMVPAQLLYEGQGVSHTHRDARLGIGLLRDGRLIVTLTRFEGLNGRLDLLPFGPTIPEMAAIMGALGASRAVLLDGGISGQLAVRESRGRMHSWRAIRNVPLGIVVVPRRAGAAGRSG